MIDFEDLLTVYEETKKNKLRSIDTISFDLDKQKNLIKLYNDINNRTLKCENNYSFVVDDPKPREIFATRMNTRILHHYLQYRLKPIYEQVLSPISFNNRIGKRTS